MPTQETIRRQIRKINAQTRGEWTKFWGDYTSQCFDLSDFMIYSLDGETRYLPEDAPSFMIHATKEGNRWFIYTEEHDIDEMCLQGQPKAGFKTLASAQQWAEEWAEEFQELWFENFIESDY